MAARPVRRSLLGAVLAAYVLGLGVVTAGPFGTLLNRLVVRLYVLFRYDVPLAPAWVLPEHYGIALNVLLFVPLGVVVLLLTGWAWWRVTLLAAAASATVEAVQWLWLDRVGTWVDVAANSVGALLGALLGAVVVSSRGGRRRP